MKFKKELIERLRAQKGLSREALARLMTKIIPTASSETIRQWEAGICEPRKKYLQALAKSLKVKERDFYDFNS